MKNSILLFLLGIFVTISIAATTPNTGILTIKPATPKSTVILNTRNYNEWENYIKKGYQVKSITTGGNYNHVYIVLEKY